MTKILSCAAGLGLLVASSSSILARGPGGAGPSGGSVGASSFSPGHQFQTSGSVTGHPGASGYAPGQLYRQKGPGTGNPGASVYAPGFIK